MKIAPCSNFYRKPAFIRHAKISAPKNVVQTSLKTAEKISLGALLTSLTALFSLKNPRKKDMSGDTFSLNEKKREPQRVEEYNKSGCLTKVSVISAQDDISESEELYSSTTGKMIQKTWFRRDGLTPQYKETYHSNTGGKDRAICYFPDGKKIKWIEEYSPVSEKVSEITWFNEKGFITDQCKCDPDLGDPICRFTFDDYGHLTEKTDVSLLTGKNIRKTFFAPTGEKLIEEYDLVTGKKNRSFSYDKSDKLVDFTMNTDDEDAMCTIEELKNEVVIDPAVKKFCEYRKELERE